MLIYFLSWKTLIHYIITARQLATITTNNISIPAFMVWLPPDEVVSSAVVLGVVRVEIVDGLTTRAQRLSTSSRLKWKVETACPVLLASLSSTSLDHETVVQCQGVNVKIPDLPLYIVFTCGSHIDPPVGNHY